jgi:hypothetical protein
LFSFMNHKFNKNDKSKRAVTSGVFVAVVVILVIIAASGFTLYATKTGSNLTQTNVLTTTTTSLIPGSVETTTIVSTATMQGLKSGGFEGSSLVTFGYTQNFQCSPSISSFGFNSTETANAAKLTPCEVGGGNSSAIAGASPVFVLVPAYAGLSIFGVQSLGANSQGYPTFNGTVIPTQCGAGGTAAACPDHPTYMYSPDFTLVEQHLGLYNGIFSLPEGVLPTPAHDHVVGFNDSNSIPWDVIAVLVFDPNIMPNAITGQCSQTVLSNLTSPTGNCLNSLSALQAALDTKTTATANANATQNDPIYDTFGGVSTQVLIPGVPMVAENSPANTNLFLYFNVVSENPYN